MEIFIGNLPRHAAVSHLNRLFAGCGRVAHFRILEKVYPDGHRLRFGHGVIEPDGAARTAIQRLNGRHMLGCPLLVREYVQRSGQDRRRVGERPERRVEGKVIRVGERRVAGRFQPVPHSWR